MNYVEVEREILSLESKREELLKKYHAEDDEVKKEKIKVDGKIVAIRLKALIIAKAMHDAKTQRYNQV